MKRTRQVSLILFGVIVAAIAGCNVTPKVTPPPAKSAQAEIPTDVGDETGMRQLLAFTPTGSMGNPALGRLLFNNPVDLLNRRTLRTNGRSCATCHIAGDAFGLSQQTAFNASAQSPLIREVMADADPDVDPHSPEGQILKRIMLDQLREVGLIRIVLRNPNYDPAYGDAEENPEFLRTWRAVPTVFNSALGINEIHTNTRGERLDLFTMWDGREPSLERQAGSATIGHAQAKLVGRPNATNDEIRAFLDRTITKDIAAFEKQVLSEPRVLARLNWQRPQENLALRGTPFEGAPVFDEATVKEKFFKTVNLKTDAEKRGLKLFTGTPDKPACITCHNMPETLAGGVKLFEDDDVNQENSQERLHAPSPEMKRILEDFGFKFSEGGRVQHLPEQKARLKKDDGSWVVVKLQDFGLAGITGRFEDRNEFKTSQLRGLKDKNRFFHDNHDLTFKDVIEHYEDVLPDVFDFNDQEINDLVEFLKAL